MSNKFIPENQLRILDPNQIKVFQTNTPESNIYLSKSVNNILNSIGNNIVLKGLDCILDSFTDTNIIFKITNGNLIIDNTLIQISDEKEIFLTYNNLNSIPYDSNSRLIIHANYQYLQTITPNEIELKLSYVLNNNTILPEGWQLLRDNVVLGIFEYTLDQNNNINSVTISEDKEITILGVIYTLYGYSEENINFTKLQKHLLNFTNIKIDQFQLPESDSTAMNVTSDNPGLIPNLTNDNRDIFTGDGSWIKNSIFQGVNNIDELRQITNINSEIPIIIMVVDSGLYVYLSLSEESDDNIHIIEPNDNIGRWKRIGKYQ